MDLIILNDGLYQLIPVTKQMLEGIELFVLRAQKGDPDCEKGFRHSKMLSKRSLLNQKLWVTLERLVFVWPMGCQTIYGLVQAALRWMV